MTARSEIVGRLLLAVCAVGSVGVPRWDCQILGIADPRKPDHDAGFRLVGETVAEALRTPVARRSK